MSTLRNSVFLKHNMIRPQGLMSARGRTIGIHPLSVHKKRIAHHLGMGAPELLLSHDLGTSSLGRGFGVKTPSSSLINGLERLNLKSSNSKRKNIRLIL